MPYGNFYLAIRHQTSYTQTNTMAREIIIDGDSQAPPSAAPLKPVFWHSGDSVDIRFTGFRSGVLLALGSVSLRLSAGGTGGASYWVETLSGNELAGDLTVEGWRGGGALAVFEVAASASKVPAGIYRLTVTGQDPGGDRETFADLALEVRADALGDGTFLDPPDPQYYTTAQADALFAGKGSEGGSVQATRDAAAARSLAEQALTSSEMVGAEGLAGREALASQFSRAQDAQDVAIVANTSAIATLGTLGSVTPYSSQADLPATTNPGPAPILAYVYNDADTSRRGLYQQAASGTTWAQLTDDFASRLDTLELAQLLESERIQTILASIYGAAALGADVLPDHFPLYSDKNGQVNIAVRKSDGRADLKPTAGTMKAGGVNLDYSTTEMTVEAHTPYLSGAAIAEIDQDFRIRKLISEHQNYATAETDITMVIFAGQSRGRGLGSLPVISLAVSPYGNFCTQAGPRYWNGTYTVLETLNEREDGSDGETPCTSFADGVVEEMQRVEGIPTADDSYRLVMTSVAISARNILALSKTSVKWATTFFSLVNKVIDGGLTGAQQKKKTFSARAVCWMHGEADINLAVYPAKLYADLMLRYRDDVEDQAATVIGDRWPLELLTDQCSQANKNYQEICLAVIYAMEQGERCAVTHPTYCVPYVDGVHHTAAGQIIAGKYFARAFHARVRLGLDWRPTYATGWIAQGKIISITYNVPDGDLALDSATLGAVTDAGFRAYDDGVAMTIAAITVKRRTVRIELSAAPSGALVVDYGLYFVPPAVPGINSVTCGGNIRDSNSETVTISGTVHPLYNWALSQRMKI